MRNFAAILAAIALATMPAFTSADSQQIELNLQDEQKRFLSEENLSFSRSLKKDKEEEPLEAAKSDKSDKSDKNAAQVLAPLGDHGGSGTDKEPKVKKPKKGGATEGCDCADIEARLVALESKVALLEGI